MHCLSRKERKMTCHPPGQTVNQGFIKTSLKGSEKDQWMFHHDNAPSHCHFCNRIFYLKRHSCGSPAPLFTWPQPLWLFPELKNVLKGHHFRTFENIRKSVMDMLKTSSAATKSGNVSTGVLLPIGTILKGITLIF